MDDWLYDEIKRWLVLEFLNLLTESYFALFDFFIAYSCKDVHIGPFVYFVKKLTIKIFKATEDVG